MKFSKTLLSIFLLAIFTISCSSDDGKDGIDGTNGVDGAPGATGTANVIYSAWITAPAAAAETIDGTSGLSTTINAPELSADIVSKGTVLVYMSFGSGVYTLPYTSTAGGFVNTISAITSVQKIKLFRFKHVADGTTVNLPTSLSWRYILIPGGVSATAKEAKLDYSKMSYEEVCARLNIQQ
ncbi:hypothetical protein DBB36_13300 [Flavobacterium sp. WLB]|uniref:hypothetical protein n=1 Tax=unclassified Flavobacterium TaxID=196869 RepID=UPI0006ABC2A8|nr:MULTISPECIES: hypothetical protein [unclassified Flavobacterium]OWU88255.1 hypothetical protein APR43_23815 [Flavobacterium sp. NLM]PUU69522.1 hypothetical protein DBB36_13300 [Flavobacterium sp. WLB]